MKIFITIIFFLLSIAIIGQNKELWGMTNKGGVENFGVIFKTDSVGNNYIVVHEFDSIGGKLPEGALTQAGNGKLYGVTSEGGAYDNGVIFEYDPSNSFFTKKYDFSGGIDGRAPLTTMMEASNGKLYGVARYEGIGGGGVLFEYDYITNNFIPKHHFNLVDGKYPEGKLIELDSTGVLYGVTRQGGDANVGVLYKFDINNNVYTKLHDFGIGGGIQARYPNGYIVFKGSFIFGTTQAGGINNSGMYYRYDYINNTFTNIIAFGGSNSLNIGSAAQAGLMKTSGEILYGVTLQGGQYNYGILFFGHHSGVLKNNDFSLVGGSYPNLPMEASNSKIYGTTRSGGNSGEGVIYEYTPSNNLYLIKHHFTGAGGKKATLGGMIEVEYCTSDSIIDYITACDSYTWIDGNTYVSSNNTSTYTLTNALGCDSVVSLNLILNSVNALVNVEALTLTALESNLQYQWINCIDDSNITGETNQSFTAIENGTYAVIVTDNNCTDTSLCEVINSVSIDEGGQIKLNIYPNPTMDILYINTTNFNFESGVLMDLSGRILFSVSSNVKSIDLSTFPKGVYVLQVESEGIKYQERIVKQ